MKTRALFMVIVLVLFSARAAQSQDDTAPDQAQDPAVDQFVSQYPSAVTAIEDWRGNPVTFTKPVDGSIEDQPDVVSGDPAGSTDTFDGAEAGPTLGGASETVEGHDDQGDFYATIVETGDVGYVEIIDGNLGDQYDAAVHDTTIGSAQFTYSVASPTVVDLHEDEIPVLAIAVDPSDPEHPITGEEVADTAGPDLPSNGAQADPTDNVAPPYPTEEDLSGFTVPDDAPTPIVFRTPAVTNPQDDLGDGLAGTTTVVCASGLVSPYGSHSIYGYFVTTHKTSFCNVDVFHRMSVRHYYLQQNGLWKPVGGIAGQIDCTHSCGFFGHTAACPTHGKYYWRNWHTLTVSTGGHNYLDRQYGNWTQLYRVPSCSIIV